ncbi:MAG: low affinity iron permease family protein [Janthinobacterium lividum]
MADKLNLFERFANWATKATGSATAFIIALLVIIVWGISGPIFKYSEVWQLVINTGTTIITFLMVFLIQKSQNKDSKAIHLKLNELIAADKYASNRMVSIEDLSERELDKLREFYCTITELAEKDSDIHESHSIDAAKKNHLRKIKSSQESTKEQKNEHQSK